MHKDARLDILNIKSRKQLPMHTREIASIAKALVPIAQLCLQTGKGAGEMILAAKLACIEVAAQNAVLADRLNHSQISAITGLTRREVKALSGVAILNAAYVVGRTKKQRIDRVLTGWITDPEFLNRDGEPLTLTLKPADATFRALVREYAGDVTPMSVLRELERVGAVHRTKDDRVRLRKSHIRAKGFSPDVVADIAQHLRDLGTTLVGNVGSADKPAYAAFQSVQALTPDEAALFQATFSERMASLLNSVSIWMRSQARIKKKAALDAGHGAMDVGIGVYLVRKTRPNGDSVRNAKARLKKR